MLTAFARGGSLRFGLETLLRGPAMVVQLLALLLVPWTVAAGARLTARWFPTPARQWGWVAFDALVIVALLSLARRWRDRLARVVTVAVAFDAVVTAGEAALRNVPRMSSFDDAVVTLTAVLAPALAFVVLWRARRRLNEAGAVVAAADHAPPLERISRRRAPLPNPLPASRGEGTGSGSSSLSRLRERVGERASRLGGGSSLRDATTGSASGSGRRRRGNRARAPPSSSPCCGCWRWRRRLGTRR